MTSLIRCRGALSEIAAHFGAQASPELMWSPTIWPGEDVLIVNGEETERRIQSARWALPQSCFTRPPGKERSSTLFARDLVAGGRALLIADALERCLIVVEDVAYPKRDKIGVTRHWIGAWDEPYLAWAGLCIQLEGVVHCAGILVPATGSLVRATANMPFFLPQGSWASWLAGDAGHAMPVQFEERDFYLEASDEEWSSGRSVESR